MRTAVWKLLWLISSSPCPHAATTSPSRASAVPSAMSTMSGYGGNDGDSDQVCTAAVGAPSVHRRWLLGFYPFKTAPNSISFHSSYEFQHFQVLSEQRTWINTSDSNGISIGGSHEATPSMFNVPWRRTRLLRNQNVACKVQLEKAS